MSNMKNLLGDMDFEVVEEILVEEDFNIGEMIELFDKHGEDTYDYWANTYGYELVDKWVDDNILDTRADEIFNKAAVYAIMEYFKWLKNGLN